uniref:Peptidase A1 domain-containing protein n=1 Tax=Cannabis sativa TaxID=3483 RepID=A0A803PEL3_CANSA
MAASSASRCTIDSQNPSRSGRRLPVLDFQSNMYDPKGSSTSKKVTCNNTMCARRNRCLELGSCPYMVSYVSAETSTSGVLIEDVLHLKREDKYQELVEAYVTFGCGQVQSGSFLDVAAPNGLFGLGMEKISVPSILSREGFIANSFSMCFGQDGVGRISFGDKGSLDQEETPFNLNPSHPTYNISVTQIRVGTTLFDVDLAALFDSGTSFTYLVDPAYTKLAESFHSQVHDTRRPSDSRIPFEYCYDMSVDVNSSLIPTLRLTMKGGSQFAVVDPIIVISTQNEIVYCLAVVKSAELNIIGQNFMTGYRVVFDREKLILGWKKFDCYDVDDYTNFSENPNSTNVPPAVAAGLSNNSTPKSTKEINKNKSNQTSSACASYPHHTTPSPTKELRTHWQDLRKLRKSTDLRCLGHGQGVRDEKAQEDTTLEHKGVLGKPPLIRGNRKKKGPAKYYKYHKNISHTTLECWYFQDEIEELICLRHFDQYKDSEANPHANRVDKEKEASGSRTPCNILIVIGGSHVGEDSKKAQD